MNVRSLACLLAAALAAEAPAAAPPAALTPQQREYAAACDRLLDQMEYLRKEGKPHCALDLSHVWLAAQQELIYGRTHMQTARAINRQVNLCMALGDWAGASGARDRQARILERLFGRYDWRTLSARQDAAELELRSRLTPEQLRQLARAEQLRDSALDLVDEHRPRDAVRPILDSYAIFRRILGETNSRSLRVLLDLAGIALRAGDLSSAEQLYQHAGALIRRTRTEQHPEYADFLGWFAQLQHARGRDDLAARLARRQVSLLSATTGEESSDFAVAQSNLGVYLTSQEEYADAEKAILRARALTLRLRGPRYSGHLTTYNNLGLLYQAMGKYEEARAQFAEAVKRRGEVHGKTHPLYAQSVSNLAGVLGDLGEPREAVRLTEQALALFRAAHGRRHVDCAICLERLGQLWQDLGDHRLAARHLEDALDILRQTRGKKHPRSIICLNNLGVLYRDLGDLPRARACLEEALALREEVHGKAHPYYATSLHNLALLHSAFEDYAAARKLYEESRDIRVRTLGPKHALVAGSIQNLAYVNGQLGRTTQARDLYEKALAIFKESRGERHPETLACQENLAVLNMDAGRTREARRQMEEVVGLARQAKRTPADLAKMLHNLAAIHSAAGDRGKARELLLESLRLRREAGQAWSPGYAVSLQNLARGDWLERRGGADLLTAQALEIVRRFADRNLATLSERQRREFLEAYSSSLSLLISFGGESLSPAQLYERVLVFKGALSARSGRDLAARDAPALRELLARLARTRADLARHGEKPPRGTDAAWLERFDALERQKEELEVRVAEASAGPPPPAVTARQIAAAVPAGSALVELVIYEQVVRPDKGSARPYIQNRALAFVIRPGRDPELVPLGPAAPLVDAVYRWRNTAVLAPEPDADSAKLLRSKLWEPIEKRLGGAKTVLLAPDGQFCALPFAALPGLKPGSFLLEEYTFAHLISGQDLCAAAAKPGDGLLVLGGANYGPKPKKGGFAVLPGTAQEAERIAGLHRKRHEESPARRLEGGKAGRRGLLDALAGRRRWRYVHLATHGFFQPRQEGDGSMRFARNPLLQSGLVLAGANQSGDGLLTAEEISGLDLRGCELAVLSACQTGVGRLAGWQGVQGLQRAFHLAGARSVAASLWSVNDPATSVLMEEFYARLWDPQKKLTPAEALRQAQLAVLRDPGRVRKQAEALHAQLKKRGFDDEVLADRGIRPKAVASKDVKPLPTRSPVVWWAAWVVSGGPAG